MCIDMINYYGQYGENEHWFHIFLFFSDTIVKHFLSVSLFGKKEFRFFDFKLMQIFILILN